MSDLIELLLMLAVPMSVLLLCRYLNRRGDATAPLRRERYRSPAYVTHTDGWLARSSR